jgi:hypothetical protein
MENTIWKMLLKNMVVKQRIQWESGVYRMGGEYEQCWEGK